VSKDRATAIDRELNDAERFARLEGAAIFNAMCEAPNEGPGGADTTCGECGACEARSSYSKAPCELCGDSHAGERHAAAIVFPGKKDSPRTYYSVCADCMWFIEYGEDGP